MGLIDKIFGGSIGEVVEKVGSAVDKFVTTDKERDELKIELTKVINEHEEKLKELTVQETDSYLKDTQSARDANARIQESDKASWLSKNIAYCMDILVSAVWSGFTLYLAGRAINLIDKTSIDLTAVLSLYATVTAVFMISMNFHRGTSRGSESKDKTISTMATK